LPRTLFCQSEHPSSLLLNLYSLVRQVRQKCPVLFTSLRLYYSPQAPTTEPKILCYQDPSTLVGLWFARPPSPSGITHCFWLFFPFFLPRRGSFFALFPAVRLGQLSVVAQNSRLFAASHTSFPFCCVCFVQLDRYLLPLLPFIPLLAHDLLT